jgi:glycerol-3-phosphate dehydrogenase
LADVNDASRLGPEERRAVLAGLAAETFDVVVIGGGVVGCGCALDAATRGLSVALVEKRDFAAGTSSRSSKLIHGRLRYLEQGEIGLVREALRERSLLLNVLAPHLVQPVPFLVPLTEHWQRAYIGAGMVLYDSLGGHEGLPRHRHLTRRGALRVAPALRREALVGAISYHDAQVDDARHTVTVARTAARFGAALVSNATAIAFLREGERVTGVRVRDETTGDEVAVRAREVVNATGVWTDDVQHLAGERGKFQVRASKGIHLVVPRDRIQLDTGLILRTETSVLFVIPWGRHWIVGTTDTDWNLDKTHPAASSTDIGYLLEHVNRVLAQPLTREDVEGVYAGLRPLLTGESESTSKLSREHTVAVPVPGLVAVAGGKYTTYRVMARDAIDAVARGLDRAVPPSVTATIELHGASGFRALWNRRERIAEAGGLHVARIEHLLAPVRRGGRRPARARPLAAGARAAAAGRGRLPRRRGRVRRLARGRAPSRRRAHPPHADLDRDLGPRRRGRRAGRPPDGRGPRLGRRPIAREVDVYHARVAAERRSQEQPDDRAADLARTAAPDARVVRPAAGTGV